MSSRALLEGSDSESDGEGKNEDDTDSNMPSKNFAILLVEKFIYEDSDKNFYLEEALKHKGEVQCIPINVSPLTTPFYIGHISYLYISS